MFRKKAIPNSSRMAVAIRYGLREGDRASIPCAYCPFVGLLTWFRGRRWVQSSTLEFDHVLPESKGGTSDPENLVLACRKCNRSKKDRTPKDWRNG